METGAPDSMNKCQSGCGMVVMPRVLIVEDDIADIRSAAAALKRLGVYGS